MSYSGVESNHRIYVEEFSDENSKKTIYTHPVVVFSMNDVDFLDSQYKLRKFIDYVSLMEDNWQEVYEKHRREDRIKIDFDSFNESMNKKCNSDEV